MRVLVSFNFLAALCLLIFGCTVERPINSFPPVAMILLAILSVVSAVSGLVGGHKWACCLDAFLVLHGINTLCQLILVVVLFTGFQGVVDAIDPKETGALAGNILQQLHTRARQHVLSHDAVYQRQRLPAAEMSFVNSCQLSCHGRGAAS